jgi:RNA polymerase sigma-70 factor (ECF subfamily)
VWDFRRTSETSAVRDVPDRPDLSEISGRNFSATSFAKVPAAGIIIGVQERTDEANPAVATGVQGLFLTHLNVIRGFIRALVRDRHLADDVLQETFLTVSRKAADFEPGTNFPRWACAVARLKVMEAQRREKGNLLFLSEEAIEALAASDDLPEQDARAELLDGCIDDLPPAMRRSVELRYVGEHKPAEIARIIGWSAEAVYVALSRARGLLRDCVERKLLETGETR